MRLFALLATLSLSVAACGQPAGPSSSVVQITPSSHRPVNPARVDRVRGDLPPGYEIVDLTGVAAPAGLWGLGPGWSAEPTQCGSLGDPVDAAVTTRGWSGSGPGGIVHVVVTGSPPLHTGLDPALIADCGHWTLAGGHTSGSVTLVDAPAVDGAATVAMSTATTTVVEGGTETHAHADTVTAYLGDYVAFVTVVTDPGSPNPPLGQDFAATLLVKTLSALRG